MKDWIAYLFIALLVFGYAVSINQRNSICRPEHMARDAVTGEHYCLSNEPKRHGDEP